MPPFVLKWFGAGSVIFLPKPPYLLFTGALTLLPHATSLFSKQFGLLPLPQEKYIFVGKLNTPTIEWLNRTFPHRTGLAKTPLVQSKNFPISLWISTHADGWGTDRQCWILYLPNSLTKSQQPVHWHRWGKGVTLYCPSNLVFVIHTSPHAQGLNGVTMSEWKVAVVEATALLDCNDVSLDRNVEGQCTLI